MFDFFKQIVSSVITFISSFGYLGIAAGMAFESACIPLPSEIILPLAGTMAASGVVTILGANIAAAAGSILGSLIAYFVGYYGGRPFIFKYGKYVLISKDNFLKAEKTFNRYGGTAVLVGRLLPIVRTYISLPAGIAKFNIKRFLMFSMIGMIPWNFTLIMLGYYLGQNFQAIIEPVFSKFEYVVLALLILLVVVFFIRNAAKKRSRTKNEG